MKVLVTLLVVLAGLTTASEALACECDEHRIKCHSYTVTKLYGFNGVTCAGARQVSYRWVTKNNCRTGDWNPKCSIRIHGRLWRCSADNSEDFDWYEVGCVRGKRWTSFVFDNA